jgi:hypothetical protein
VNCDQPGKGHTINETLRQLNPAGPNTVVIHGTCRESLFIEGFDRLTLRGAPGAIVSDASGGQVWAVVLISDSRRLVLRDLKITGGMVGIACTTNSDCQFANNTMEGQSQSGFHVSESNAYFSGDTIRNVTGPGVYIWRSKVSLFDVTSERNFAGLWISSSSVFADRVTANSNSWGGVLAMFHSDLELVGSTVTNNSQSGIQGSNLTSISLGNNTVTGNSSGAVWLSDMSTARFGGIETYANNGEPSMPQVQCAPYYTVVVNLPAGVSTNCTTH